MGNRGITLRGAAAGALVEMMTGRAPKTEDDKQMRIATAIHFAMKKNTREGEAEARAIVSRLEKDGIDATLKLLMEGIKPSPPPQRRGTPKRDPDAHLLPGEKIDFSMPPKKQ